MPKAKKTATKKTSAKKPVAKKSNALPYRKTTSPKTVKKAASKKSVVKKKTVATKKPVARKIATAAKKAPAKKVSAKKASVSVKKKTVAVKKSSASIKKTVAKKSSTVKKDTAPKNAYRLPRTILPDHYQITLQPNLETKTFTGHVAIDISVLKATNAITLHTKELVIKEASVQNKDGIVLEAAKTVKYDKEKEFATLSFPKSLSAGEWTLVCSFTGILNDKLKGFYYSTWIDEHNNKHPMAVTQFESTDARRAFPCFDEPDFKATYDVTLIVPKNLTAISNGRIVSETVDDTVGLKTVKFKKTMKMSTYLLAFLVGEFIPSKPVKAANGIELRSWTVPGKENLTPFSLEVAAFTIDYFEKYFGVPYPAPDKCDLIAIPDFAAGAMENKDCITFRETALLVDEKTSTHAELERVAEVVMHELAHMWFGDLVTMKWWNGLWLNEAFATFMEMKALDNYKPEWKVWDKFGISRAAAFRVDSLKSTHPIECPVKKAEEAQELFDVISYQKGCSVLYQIEQFIGEDVFQKGINYYLNEHSYGNTETHDLWDGLEEGCNKSGIKIPVRKIMDNWVFTAGHPIVSVKEGKQANSIEISQKLFRFLPPKTNDVLYQVPISMLIVYEDGTKETEKLLVSQKAKTIKFEKSLKYIVVNAGGSGFYRVSYGSSLVNKLLSKPKENLSVIERFNLVNDSWAAVKGGFMPAVEYLDMIKLFVDEDDVNVWQIILSSLNGIKPLTKGPSREDFKHFVKNLCEPKAKELTWQTKDSETSQTKELRALLLDALGTMAEDNDTYAKAQEFFASWQKDKTSIDSNLLPSIVHILAYYGDDQRYEEFHKMYKEAKTPQETMRFLYSLAQFKKEALLAKTMGSCISDDVRTQDAPFVLIHTANNEVAMPAVWQFLKKNWNKMVKAYPDTGMVRLCSNTIPVLDTEALEKDAKTFFSKNKVKSGDMAISQAFELLRVNLLFKERETKKIADYLKKAN